MTEYSVYETTSKNYTIIKVCEITGDHCFTIEDGEKVYDLIIAKFNKNLNVELDFTGVYYYAVGFFHGAIGKLLGVYSSNELNERLSFSGLTSLGTEVLRSCISNAIKYYLNRRINENDIVYECKPSTLSEYTTEEIVAELSKRDPTTYTLTFDENSNITFKMKVPNTSYHGGINDS